MPTIAVNSEAEWLSIREENIGGSEVTGLFCNWMLPDRSVITLHGYEAPPEGAIPLGSCSSYTTPYKLFLNKTGKLMPEDFNPSERMQAGTYLEPALAEWARAKFDMKLRKVRRYHLHPTVSGWGASLDYEVHGPGMDPVEFKNIDYLVARDQWVIEGDEVISAPLHIMLQLQHYIGARDAKQGWIIACVAGNQLVRGCFPRHEPTIERLQEAIVAFWDGVARNEAPIGGIDFEVAKEEFAYGQKGSVARLHGDTEASTLARRYLRWKRHYELTEGVLSHVKGLLAAKVGENDKAEGDGFKVTWPVINREAKLIPAREQAAMTYRGGFTVKAI